jgi:NitT/TauT family transport system permease protein
MAEGSSQRGAGVAATATALAGLDVLDLPPEARASGRRQFLAVAWRVAWPKALAAIIALAAWELISVSGWKKLIFPAPGDTLSNLWDQLQTGLLWHALGTTLYRAVLGFALALFAGVVVGALVSRVRPLRAAIGSLITGLQTMPSIAWFPFAIILFGLTTQSILFVVVLAAWSSIANGLIAGSDLISPLLLKNAHMMGLRGISLYRRVILPASLPAFVAGLKQAWAFAWHSLMAGELLVLIANQPSIGVLLSTDQDQSDLVSATAIIIVILVIGIIVDMVFGVSERGIRRRRGLA